MKFWVESLKQMNKFTIMSVAVATKSLYSISVTLLLFENDRQPLNLDFLRPILQNLIAVSSGKYVSTAPNILIVINFDNTSKNPNIGSFPPNSYLKKKNQTQIDCYKI